MRALRSACMFPATRYVPTGSDKFRQVVSNKDMLLEMARRYPENAFVIVRAFKLHTGNATQLILEVSPVYKDRGSLDFLAKMLEAYLQNEPVNPQWRERWTRVAKFLQKAVEQRNWVVAEVVVRQLAEQNSDVLNVTQATPEVYRDCISSLQRALGSDEKNWADARSILAIMRHGDEALRSLREAVVQNHVPAYVLWTVDTWAPGPLGDECRAQIVAELNRVNQRDGFVLLTLEIFNLERLDIYLTRKKMRVLPESFVLIDFRNCLNLDYNQLTSLPESFGAIQAGKDLFLDNNQLTSLPESFGNVKVKGSLYLDHNQLTSLPESFGGVEVEGSLLLDDNKLTSLPKSFENLQVGKKLFLNHNQLTSIPPKPEKVKREMYT